PGVSPGLRGVDLRVVHGRAPAPAGARPGARGAAAVASRKFRELVESEGARCRDDALLVLSGGSAARADRADALTVHDQRAAARVDDDPRVGRVPAPVVAAGL